MSQISSNLATPSLHMSIYSAIMSMMICVSGTAQQDSSTTSTPSLIALYYSIEFTVEVSGNKINSTINFISLWLSRNGFRFTLSNSNLEIFEKRSPKHPFPPLLLNSVPISPSCSVKFLGLIFLYRYPWLPHIKAKAKNLRALNFL